MNSQVSYNFITTLQMRQSLLQCNSYLMNIPRKINCNTRIWIFLQKGELVVNAKPNRVGIGLGLKLVFVNFYILNPRSLISNPIFKENYSFL